MKHLVLVIALVAFSTAAFAGYQDVDELRLVRAVSVVIDDQVKDGCLSSPNALKVEAELILRRSGIRITESDLIPELRIRPFGWERKREGGQPSGRCVVVLAIELSRWARVPEGHLALIIAHTIRKVYLLAIQNQRCRKNSARRSRKSSVTSPMKSSRRGATDMFDPTSFLRG